MLIDVGYVVENVLLSFKVVFLAILAVAIMEIWTTRNKDLYDGANISLREGQNQRR